MSSSDVSNKSRENEDRWFLQHEKEMLLEIKRKRQEKMDNLAQEKSTEEIKTLRETHWMKCPKCGHDMETIEMEGVAIDKCGTCDGLYFDAGELETLLDHHDDAKKGVFKRLLGLD